MPSDSSQGQNQKSRNLHSPSFEAQSTIPTNHFTKNSTPEPYESTKIPSGLRLLHSELVITSRKFEQLEIPISSYGALECKPLGESTKASNPEEQKSTKLKTELWFFHSGLGIFRAHNRPKVFVCLSVCVCVDMMFSVVVLFC
jgi:hypothetical protein